MGEAVSGRRIGLLISTSTGGVGRHVHSLVAGLLEHGAAVTVCGAREADDVFGFTSLGAAFIPVAIPALPVDMPVRRSPLADVTAIRTLRPVVADLDVVHAHGLRAGVVGGLALSRRRRPAYVVSWHNAVLGSPRRRRVLGLAERYVARTADVTLGASPDLVERARQLGSPRALDIAVAAPPLPAPLAGREHVRATLGASDRPLVVAVGRLSAQKRFDVLVEASAVLTRHQPEPMVVIAGSGPTEGRVAAQIASTGAPVRLLGRRDDVADLLEAADVVVLPSAWEARALIAQEALRAGRPLVATAVGGIPDLVGDAAVLVPPGDADALAAAIASVLDDPALAARLSTGGPRRAAKWPGEADTVAAVVDVYAELLRSRS